MAKEEISLTVAPAAWGAMAAEMLAECFTVPGALECIGQQVEAGAASLFMADAGGEIVAAFVLRVEGNEGVVVAARGTTPGMIAALLPNIENRFIGCRAVRFHTAKPALAKVMARYGFAGQEVVLRKELH